MPGDKYHHKVPGHLMADYRDKMKGLSEKDRNFVKEVMAEQYMEKTAELRGNNMTVTPADKGMRGGPDGDARSKSGHQTRLEAKAETSPLSRGQRNPAKTLQTDPSKVERNAGQFQRAGTLDKQAAQESRAHLEMGGSVTYEVNRTSARPDGFETKVKAQGYAKLETDTKGGEVTTTHDPSAIRGGFRAPQKTTLPLDAKARPTAMRTPAPSKTGGSPARATGSRAASPSPGPSANAAKPGGPQGGPSGSLGTMGGPKANPGGGVSGGM